MDVLGLGGSGLCGHVRALGCPAGRSFRGGLPVMQMKTPVLLGGQGQALLRSWLHWVPRE